MYFSRAAAALIAALALTACGAHKTTVVSSDGSTVTTNDNGKTTVNTKEGSVTVGGDVDPAKLGAPVYPGATKNEGGTIAVTQGNGSHSVATFTTPDSFDKVYSYYKAQLPSDAEKMKVEQGGSSLASFQVADAKSGESTSVMIEGKGDQTQIIISHGNGADGASPSPSSEATE